jgi:hypothetical protein
MRSRSGRVRGGALLALLLAVSLTANILWVVRWRHGLPLDINEAGYLQRAVSDGTAISSGGLTGLWQALHTSDAQAPLVPALAGLVRALTGAGPTGLTLTQQLFLVVLGISTYSLARRLTSRRWALLAAGLVAVIPGIVEAGRTFDFALPATAMVTAVLATQLWAGDFSSSRRSLMWGIMLGLAALTRSMLLGLLPALVLAAALRLLAGDRRGRRLAHLAAGLAAGAGVAAIWLSAAWNSVVAYVLSYAYGSNASASGQVSPLLSWSRWTSRLVTMAQADLYLPLTLALGLCLLAGAITAAWRWSRRSTASVRPHPRLSRRAAAAAAGDAATVVIFLAWGYLALSSTDDAGSELVMPLLPALVVLAVICASRVPWPAAPRLAVCCLLAGALACADQAALLPGAPSDFSYVSLGRFSIALVDGRGTLLSYADYFEDGGCPTVAPCGLVTRGGTRLPALRAWMEPAQRMATILESDAAANDRSPVVFFAVQDPFFNVNTVGLDYQLEYGRLLPTGLLRPPGQAGMSLVQQLEDPQLGEPNLVILGTPPKLPAARAFSPLSTDVAALAAVRADGFSYDGAITLPDGRVMQVWWKDRGTTATAPAPGAH